MDADYARGYRELYERHWWWRARERLILDRIERLRPEAGWGRILDVGCGDGLFFDELSRYGTVEGVEPDAAIVAPDGRWRGRITVGPFDERFRPGHRFGLILFLDVLEHLADPAAALTHARGLLEPEGTVVATVPASMRLWSSHDVLNRHYVRYTPRTLRRLFEDAGYRVDDVRHAFHWTYAPKLGVALAERVVAGAPSPPRVPPAPVNRALLALTRLEQALTRRVRVPFGSSLIAVARPA